MSDFLDFLKSNYQILIVGCLAIAEILLLIFKKVKVKDVGLSHALAKIPDLIVEAEKTQLKGQEKFLFVFNLIIDYISTTTSLSKDETLAKYSQIISNFIESILTTPQKKEVNYEKNN